MGCLSAITGTYFLKINGFCHKSTTNRFVGCLIDVFDIITVCFFHTFELPFGNHLTALTACIGDGTFENGTFSTINIFDSLFVGYFPSIVGRRITLSDNTAEVSSLPSVELSVRFSVHLLTTVSHTHLAVVTHRGKHRTRHQISFGFFTCIVSWNTPASIQRNRRNREIPTLSKPSTTAFTTVLYAQRRSHTIACGRHFKAILKIGRTSVVGCRRCNEIDF